MKTVLPLLNSIGFTNEEQKALYAASVLDAATVSNASFVISAAIPAIPAKPAQIAQTAKPARAATAAVLAAANTIGYAFGELYLNSPAYPIGTAIPAIPAKPASVAVIGYAATPLTPAVAAIMAPAVTARKGWDMAIEITKTTSNIRIEAYLPYASNGLLVGASVSGVSAILEITPSDLAVTQWIDSKASLTPETLSAEVPTLEQYLYKQALAIIAKPSSTSTIDDVIYVAAGVPVACKHLILDLPATDYLPEVASLQLGKLALEPRQT
jgi:hypothetical protein